MWNPAISSITIHNHIDSIAHIDDWEFNWSVYEWEKAHEGDRFYLVRVGEGKTGIVMSGVFTSEPYTDRDWNRLRQSRQIYYMDMHPNFIVNPETMPIITTAQLQEAIPDFEWSKGHSGKLLTDEQAEQLEQLFKDYLATVKGMVDEENLVILGADVNRFDKYFDSHGDHIETIMPPDQFVYEQLPEIGSWPLYGKAVCRFSNKSIKNEEVEIVALRVGSEMGMAVLLLKGEEQDKYDIITVYPMHKGTKHRLQITKIQELKNQIEAVVHAETEELSLAFFATDYFLNKDKYIIGNQIDIELSACAYSLYEGEEETVLDEETSAKMRKDMGLEEEFDEDGNLKPLTLYNGELVAFLNNNEEEYPDDVSFASKVKSVKSVSLFDNKYVKATVSICHEPEETYIPLYLKKEMMEGVHKGTLLRGVFWLQGKIAEDYKK
jgi:hypothetical protein